MLTDHYMNHTRHIMRPALTSCVRSSLSFCRSWFVFRICCILNSIVDSFFFICRNSSVETGPSTMASGIEGGWKSEQRVIDERGGTEPSQTVAAITIRGCGMLWFCNIWHALLKCMIKLTPAWYMYVWSSVDTYIFTFHVLYNLINIDQKLKYMLIQA